MPPHAGEASELLAVPTEREGAVSTPELEALPPLRRRHGVSTRVFILMASLVLAVAATAGVVTEQQRRFRATFDLLTGVYMPFQERLTKARVQAARIHELMRASRDEDEPVLRSRHERRAFADALVTRGELVGRLARTLEQALSHSDRFGGDEAVVDVRQLLDQVQELEALVVLEEADAALEFFEDARRQDEVVRRFARLERSTRRVLRSQGDAVRAQGRRAESFATLMSAAAALMAVLAALGVLLTLRPLGRLTAEVRGLAEAGWGQPIRVSRHAAIRDNEVSRLAREFRRMAATLQERERGLLRGERLAAIGRMSAQITHEIRNPLSAVALNAELLEDELEQAGPEAAELLRQIVREVERLTAITEDYLGFARRPDPRLEALDLQSELEELLAFLREEHERGGLEVSLDGLQDAEGGAKKAWANADARQIRQALLNLLRNAQEAALGAAGPERSPRLRVGLEASGEGWILFVEDNGSGLQLPPDQRDRIFEAFFTRKAHGTGLGLPVVRQIAQDHGGEVRLTRTDASGSRFELWLPSCDPPDATVSSPGSVEEAREARDFHSRS